MNLGLVSVRYSRALLKASIEAKQSEQVYNDMTAVAENYVKLPRLRTAVDNPMLSKQQKEELLVAAAAGTTCQLTKTFIALVLKEGRESIMQFIANSFISLYRKENNLVSAKLTTATALNPGTEARLRQLVESKTNGKVEFKAETEPDIIGGFVLEYDTYRMDASVRTQLNAILSKLI